jgi:hypothetical protein
VDDAPQLVLQQARGLEVELVRVVRQRENEAV